MSFATFVSKTAVKVALIVGITGQDGSYLAELLLNKGYIVHGVKRRTSTINTARIDHLYGREMSKKSNTFFLHYGDVTDIANMINLIQSIQPDEIYNLAAQSHVAVSFEMPIYSTQVDALGTLNLLEAIRISGLAHKTKFYQASTSELYGKVQEIPQTETTPFYPRSPYGVAKLYGYWITKHYREAYGIFACNGILFNHESPRRGETFVTRKITQAVARIKHGLQDIVYLGNLDAQRDWGYAPDYVYAMWRMLQQEEPDDFVIATGQTHSVREFVQLAFECAGIILEWQGEGIEEVGIDRATGKPRVRIDPRYFRPTEVDILVGNPEKAFNLLGWRSEVTFEQLVKLMVEADCSSIAQERSSRIT